MKQGMNVFIWDETTEEQKKNLETEIKALEGVNTVVFKNKQEALEDMKSRFKNNQELKTLFANEIKIEITEK